MWSMVPRTSLRAVLFPSTTSGTSRRPWRTPALPWDMPSHFCWSFGLSHSRYSPGATLSRAPRSTMACATGARRARSITGRPPGHDGSIWSRKLATYRRPARPESQSSYGHSESSGAFSKYPTSASTSDCAPAASPARDRITAPTAPTPGRPHRNPHVAPSIEPTLASAPSTYSSAVARSEACPHASNRCRKIKARPPEPPKIDASPVAAEEGGYILVNAAMYCASVAFMKPARASSTTSPDGLAGS